MQQLTYIILIYFPLECLIYIYKDVIVKFVLYTSADIELTLLSLRLSLRMTLVSVSFYNKANH